MLVLVVLLGIAYALGNKTPTAHAPVSEPNILAQVTYYCDAGRTIEATYKDIPSTAPSTPVSTNASAGTMPQPTGSVDLVLSDGRTLQLQQTISASGVRYSNGEQHATSTPTNETFVFWSKGSEAFVLESGQQNTPQKDIQEETYTNCIAVAKDTGNVPLVYADGADGFSIRYPHNFTVHSAYAYTGVEGVDISGVQFTIDPAMATGTNLSNDSYLSVEKNTSAVESCTAGNFLTLRQGATEENIALMGTSYSVASSTDAGAGNRYEEWVYAIPGTRPCRAIRYFIHYSVFENYPAGTITAFDKTALLDVFDAMRSSLTLQ